MSAVWTYEGYWAAVIGDFDAATAVAKFDLKPGDDRGFSEWLGEAEAIVGIDRHTEFPSDYHKRAVRELSAAANGESPGGRAPSNPAGGPKQ